MRRREEKRRKFHEALLQTLYPRSSSSSPSSSPARVENVDEESFDVTLINPEDYLNVDSSNHGHDDNETGEDSAIVETPSRAQRKRLRKKMLKEEATRRRNLIGPLLPTEMVQTRDAGDSNSEDHEEASCTQPVRRNVHEKQENISGNGKTRKVKKRREAKKLAKETSNKDPT